MKKILIVIGIVSVALFLQSGIVAIGTHHTNADFTMKIKQQNFIITDDKAEAKKLLKKGYILQDVDFYVYDLKSVETFYTLIFY